MTKLHINREPGQYEPRGNGVVDGLPSWARFTTIVGVPGAIAIYLVYMVATKIPADLEAHARETRTAQQEQTMLLRQICMNTAIDGDARRACWGLTQP